MAQVLGAPATAHAPSQKQTTSSMAGMTPRQMYHVLRDLRNKFEDNPAKGREVLTQNPHLTKALFQAQIILGMVNPDAREPLPDQSRAQNRAPLGNGAAAPQPQVNPAAPTAYLAPGTMLQPGAVVQPGMMQPGAQYVAMPAGAAPVAQQPQFVQQPQFGQPQQQQQFVQQMPLQQQQQQQQHFAQPTQQQTQPAAVDPAQLEMLRQVMQLTAEQLANLTPDQKAQVEQVKQYAMQHGLL